MIRPAIFGGPGQIPRKHPQNIYFERPLSFFGRVGYHQAPLGRAVRKKKEEKKRFSLEEIFVFFVRVIGLLAY
jgi:hypothetical protein